jgi:hypothetical protein
MRSLIAICLSFIAFTVSGCANAEQAPPEVQQTVETVVETEAPEPEPVEAEFTGADKSEVMTTEQAADLYLQAICPTNEYLFMFNKQMKSWIDSKKALSAADKKLFASAAKESRAGAQLLDTTPAQWPPGTEAGIEEVIVSLLQDVSKYQKAAKAKTQSDAYFARYEVIDGGINSNSQAQLVRLRLELPPADAKNDGCGPYKKMTP